MTTAGVWEILIETPPNLHERVGAWLEEHGHAPVERLLTTEDTARDEEWKHAGLSVFLADDGAVTALVAALAVFGAGVSVTTRFLPEESWQGVWDESIETFATARFLVTTAPNQRDEQRMVIQLAPSEAFGDGKHVTTRLTLAFLDELLQNHVPQSLLDVGCGNGVLSFAAALSGVPLVAATDVMEDAITATQRGSTLNGVTIDVRLDAEPFDGRTFEWVVANIPAAGLVSLMGSLRRSLAPAGRLILAGFFAGDAAFVERAAADAGLACDASREEQGWTVMSFRAAAKA